MTQGGGLLQLVAQGKQDVFLTGNPSVTWFKFVYNRYTNFAVESQQMYFDGSPNFGQKLSCLVPRNGDLLGPIFLKVTLPQLYLSPSSFSPPSANPVPVGYVNSPGHALIKEISIQIGEQEIDKQTGQWMEIWSSLTTDASQKDGFQEMIQQKSGYPRIDYLNNAPDLSGGVRTLPKNVFSRENGNLNVDISGIKIFGPSGQQIIQPTTKYPSTFDEPIMGPITMYIPLRFWFNKNPGLYLPLLSMQYHPVRINLTLTSIQEMFYTKKLYNYCSDNGDLCVTNNISAMPTNTHLDIQMWGDYVFLDVPERRRFVSSTLEYLIEQVQYTPPLAIPANSKTATLQLNFNHPIKEFIWVLQRNVSQCRHEYFNWSSLGFYEIEMAAAQNLPEPGHRTDLMASANIQLDGKDRFDPRDPLYFRLVQPYQRHTAIPSDRYIYVYSIALRPEEQQPSGTLNASRIDNIVLQLGLVSNDGPCSSSGSTSNMSAFIYARNYNVLRVINGYAGLLFSV
jgi:hypothetical protein